MTDDAPRLPSLRGRVRTLLAVTFVIIGAVALMTAASLVRLIDTRERILDELDPAGVRAAQLLGAYLDQESGVRGYLASQGREAFLDPFRSGVADAERLRAELGDDLADHPRARDALAAVDDATERWRTDYADPTIETVSRGGLAGATDESLDEGRVLFDEVRRSFAVLQTALAGERADAIDDLEQATAVLVFAVVALAGMSITAKIVLWRTYHAAVAVPLDQLGVDATAVADGDLDHPIRHQNHAELAALRDAMEEMRTRLVEDLHAIEGTYAALEEKAAELERSNGDLEQFAYVASHDLQEPLRKVISFTQLLQNRYGDKLDERADEYIAYAVDGARRMQDLINDLLAFSRVGRLTRDHVEVELDQVVDQALANLGTALDESGGTIERGPLPAVVGDPVLLVSLFQNLIGNGLKFHRPGVAPVVTLSAERHDDAWTVRVVDNGIGIEEEFEERVFVIFQRLHGKEAYEGTGIGLAMCRKIVEHHGGTIRIEHGDGPGTCIAVTLPDRAETESETETETETDVDRPTITPEESTVA